MIPPHHRMRSCYFLFKLSQLLPSSVSYHGPKAACFSASSSALLHPQHRDCSCLNTELRVPGSCINGLAQVTGL